MIVASIFKIVVAATTFGTSDVARWMDFAAGVAKVGPVSIYRLSFDSFYNVAIENHPPLYNHPPLIGYLLQAINAATRRGLAFPLAIRIPAIAADVVTPFIVLELLRRRRTLLESFAAAASVAVSPALFVISGFHGNTDPVFVMFALLSVYLLVDRQAPALAGLSIAIALGVKIVPIVIVPTLVVFAVTVGWRTALRFCLGAGAFLALTWGPVILHAWQPFRDHVLGYSGGHRAWGLAQLARWSGHPAWAVWTRGPGRFVIVLVVAGLPAVLVLWRPGRVVEASALALTGLLLLSPAFATRYMVWALAPAYLLSFSAATAFNLVASCLLIEVYNRWCRGLPWYLADDSAFTTREVLVAFAAWVALLIAVVAGVRRFFPSGQPPPSDGAASDAAAPDPGAPRSPSTSSAG